VIAMTEAGTGQVGLARLEPADAEPLRRLFYRLSPNTIYRRFHSPLVRPEQGSLDRLLDLDHRDREAVVATVDGEIVGVARYHRWPGTNAAELAVVVADDWQGRTVATRMLAALTDLAAKAGIERFTVSMQADNVPAIGLLRRFAPEARLTLTQGLLEGTLSPPPLRRG
jgi:RimJ/RimL family protein N-acetyltransferase